MDRVVGAPKIEDGIAWLPVRVDGLTFKVGAPQSGDWTMFHISKPSADVQEKARALAEAWERDNPADAAALFADAAAQQKAASKP